MNELLVLSAPSRRDLAERTAEVSKETAGSLAELAVQLAERPAFPWRLAILAEDRDDLVSKLGKARELLAGDRPRFNVGNRIFCGEAGEGGRKTAFLFPGFGAQYPNMLGRLYAASAAVRRWFNALDPKDAGRSRRNLLLFSDAEHGPEDKLRLTRESTLRRITDAVLMANLAHYSLLAELGLPCDAMAGHSYGETALLVAAGMVADYRPVTQLLGRITQVPPDPAGRLGPSVLLAVTGASRAVLEPLLADPARPVFLALDNCPQQAILCGATGEMEAVEAIIKERKELCFRLPRIELAVHTPLFPAAPGSLREIYGGLELGPPALPVYSCATAAPFPPGPEAARDLLADGWVRSVRFRETVERLYADGIRTFVEVGPGGHLAGFVRDTLRGTGAVAIPTDREEVDSALQIRLCLAQLFVLGHRLDLARVPEVLGEQRPAAPARVEERAPETDARRREMEELVLRQVAAILDLSGTEMIDPRRGFFELGLGSLGSIELAERLGRALGRPLPPTAAFDHPTAERLAGFLLGESAPERRPLKRRREEGPEPVAIVGMACRFPGAGTPEAFWELLRRGGDAVGEVPAGRWGSWRSWEDLDRSRVETARHGGFLETVDRFDAAFFGISPREALTLDPQQRLLLEITWEALERAAIPPGDLAGTASGVFIGISTSDYALRLTPRQRLAAGGYLGTGTAHSTAAGRISHVFGLTGPCLAVDTACSSSLVAVHLACQSLRQGESDLALAGGVNLLLAPETSLFLAGARALSPQGRCKTFDADADGYVRAEGCGMVVLKRLSDALAAGDDVLAVIRGSAVNHDGHTSGLTVPSGVAQQAVVRRALADGGVEPEAVSYVEAHGTGTSLGDPIEVGALGQVFGARPKEAAIRLGSVKTNLGHLESAAGIAGLIKVVLQLRHREIAPSLHFRTPNPRIDWERLPFEVATRPAPWTNGHHPLTAGLSSFGISGSNAHVVLQEAPNLYVGAGLVPAREGMNPSPASPEGDGHHLMTLSAKTERALAELATRVADTLPKLDLADACYTSNIGRSHLPYRLAVVARTGEGAAAALRESTPAPARRTRPRLACLFTGQGSQYPGMGRRLFDTEPVFRQTLEECGELLEIPLPDLLFGDSDGLDQTAVTQPALFALEYALARLWRSWGVEPAAVLGHSVGEYVAACVAGVFDLPDALRLVAARGRLMQSLPAGGAMLSVAAPEAELTDLGVDVAAVNAPGRTVLSGPGEAIRRAARLLEARGLRSKPLRVSHAFHSRLMDPILSEFQSLAAGITYRPPRIPLISNLNGKRTDVAYAGYWVRQLREPVRFADGVQALKAEGCDLFLEIGPKPVLISLGRDCLPDEDGAVWVASLHPPRDEREQMLAGLGRLYEAGVDADWRGFHRFHRGRRGRRVALPTYPFQRERYWIDVEDSPSSDVGAGLVPARAGASPAPTQKRSLGDIPPAEREERVRAYLRDKARDILLYPRDRPLDERQPLHELGFDSIMAVRFRNRLRSDLGVDVPAVKFLEEPTLANLAELVLERLATDGGEMERSGSSEGTSPLSYGQRALWFLWRLAPGSSAYNQSLPIRIRGQADPGTWRAACRALLARHSMLRTTFPETGGEPVQRVQPAAEPDWAEAEDQSEAAMAAAHQEPFDLEHGPVARFRWFGRGSGAPGAPGAILLVTLHHIVCDGWSLELILRDLRRLAAGHEDNETPPPPEHTYHDFVRWQRALLAGPEGERLWAYWRQQLAEPRPVLALPTDRPRPAVQTYRGGSVAVAPPPALAGRLRALAAAEGATLSTTLMAAFVTLLHRYTDQRDLQVGMPQAGRGRPEMAEVVGYFVDPLVIRVRIGEGWTFRELLRDLKRTVLDAFAHADFPFALLVEKLSPERDSSRSPLFDVTFNHLSLKAARRARGESGLEVFDIPQADGKFDLTLTIADDEPGLTASFGYNLDLFERQTVARLADCFVTLLEGLAADPEERLDRLPLMRLPEGTLPPVKQGKPLAREPKLVHRLFEERAADRPDAPAVQAGGAVLTFGELNRRANGLACRLRELGVREDVPVGVLTERSVEPLVAILAVLKAGGAYLPIDPGHPRDLAAYMLTHARAAAVLTQGSLVGALPELDIPVLHVEHVEPAEENPRWRTGPGDLAYVMYTSGSTGRPKGVAVEHRSLSNYVASMLRDLGFQAGRFALVSTIGADLGNTMIFPALCIGGCLHVLAGEALLDRQTFADTLLSEGIDYLKIVPSHLAALTDTAAPVLPRKAVVLGGEGASPRWVESLMARAPGCRFFNHYGPTETTVGVLTCKIDGAALSAGSATLPLRIAVAGAEVHLLDAGLRPVPPGVVGELYLGGACLARGYIHAPELTEASFIPHPVTGAVLYRTGDLARQLGDLRGGDLEILGRRDRQLKLRGYRIELGQIEASLRLSPAVAQGVVLPDAEGREARQLLAYVVPAPDAGDHLQHRLRRELEGRLPGYMVPQTFVVLDAIPLTTNGKVDHQALRRLGGEALREREEPVQPRDLVELRLGRIWSEVLGVPHVGPRDNFFRLGGHSLLAVRLAGRVYEEFGQRISLAALFTCPTVQELAGVLRSGGTRGAGVLVPLRKEGARPPLAVLPGAGGNVLYFHELSRHLHPDQPLWGLQALGMDDGSAIPDRLEEIASRYVEILRRDLLKEGPWRLLGHSFGGLVAFEMARQLLARGEEVAFLGVLDNAAPDTASEEDYTGWGDAEWLRHIATRIGKLYKTDLGLRTEGFAALAYEDQLRHLVDRLVAAGLLPVETHRGHFARFIEVYRANAMAAARYRPGILPAPGRLTLFKACEIDPELERAAVDDPALGWNRYTACPVAVVEVPGTHLSMTAEPHVGELARRVEEALTPRPRAGG
jgi:amino acid adenylation domain-containing protein